MATLLDNIKKLFSAGRAPKNRNLTGTTEMNSVFRFKYTLFKELLAANSELLAILTDMEEKLRGNDLFGMAYIRSQINRSLMQAFSMVKNLNVLSNGRHKGLYQALETINRTIAAVLDEKKTPLPERHVMPYSLISKNDADWVGGKSANLGEIRNSIAIPVPEGFAITTRAFDTFLDANELRDEIRMRKTLMDVTDPDLVTRLSREIAALILEKPVPDEVASEMLSAYDSLWAGKDHISVAMRSSAIGEDGALTFAGQYLTLLNVNRDQLCQAYKSIIASLYSVRSITYRIEKGIYDDDLAMAVACIRMVESVASGVLYSRHPYNLNDNAIVINAVWGLGPYAVDGVIVPDTYTAGGEEPHKILTRTVSRKSVKLICSGQGGVTEIPVPESLQSAPCLTDEQVTRLAGYGSRIQDHYGTPQDIEWALDQDGTLLILQARPLKIETISTRAATRALPVPGFTVILETSDIASRGIGTGPAVHVRSDNDLRDFPGGGVLVAHHSSPEYVVVMKRCSAIITESGSISGHMAALAREFHVPALLGAVNALQKIPQGMAVTVDAYTGRIYEGIVPELAAAGEKRAAHMEGTPVFLCLKQVAQFMTPLNLVNPRAENFTPAGCRTLHDIARYCHENTYTEMFNISDLTSKLHGWSFKLDAPLPIDLHLIDLGGGLKPDVDPGARQTTVDQIMSVPLLALLDGMLDPRIAGTGPRPVNFSGLLSVMREQAMAPGHVGERFGDRSYAIISDKYLNFSSRVGYHYSVVDAWCGNTINKNYITFSFKGGAADTVKRGRRVRAIALILEKVDFTVTVKEDKIDAKLQKYPPSFIQERLKTLGRLLIFTRQMDMLMTTEQSVEKAADHFFAQQGATLENKDTGQGNYP
ncbi:MAG: PEP/pyruvate-binding domain-containing protein [Pseudomonadota bacterium]